MRMKDGSSTGLYREGRFVQYSMYYLPLLPCFCVDVQIGSVLYSNVCTVKNLEKDTNGGHIIAAVVTARDEPGYSTWKSLLSIILHHHS